jgi:hypothetical protein
VEVYNLKTGLSKSCGCIRTEKVVRMNKKHGMSGTATWHCWKRMLQRCKNKKHPMFKHYGGRGVTARREWTSFEKFYKDMGDKPAGMSLGRIDNNGNYSKTNCRWETQKQQNRNYRRNRNVTFEGKTMCIKAWSETTGIKPSTIRARLKSGLSPSEALAYHLEKVT